MLVTSALYYTVIGVKVAAADGTELAGRALTYVFIPVGFVLAAFVGHRLSTSRRWKLNAVVATTLAGVLFLGGLAGGWPPAWERLPGGFQVAGFERSVEPQGVATAQWARQVLGHDNRFAADLTNYTLLGTYGEQDVIRQGATLYYSAGVSPEDQQIVASTSLRYLVVDRRLAEGLPASGRYFPDDPQADKHTVPLPLEDLTKFDAVPGIRRIYDSGDIVIYDLSRSSYAP
jgi:hypothetical protein